jgi:hypothetical protein
LTRDELNERTSDEKDQHAEQVLASASQPEPVQDEEEGIE